MKSVYRKISRLSFGTAVVSKRHSKTTQSLVSGFTLFESMIAITIVTIIASVSFSGLAAYTEYFALRDSVRSLESTVRTAQGYAISIQDVNVEGSNQFFGRFGVKIERSVSDEVILFADTQVIDTEPGYNVYDGGNGCGGTECLYRITFPRGVHIIDICTIGTNDLETCGRNRVDIVFVRPRTDAHIYIDGLEDATIKELRVTLATLSEDRELSITVGATGFITSL